MSDPLQPEFDEVEFLPDDDSDEPSPFDVESLESGFRPSYLSDWESVPTPGFLGAIGWSAAALVLHLIGGFIALVIVLSIALSGEKNPIQALRQLAGNQRALETLIGGSPGIIVGVEMVTFGVGVILLTMFYFRKNLRAALPLQTPRWQHALVVLAWFMPLSIFCSQLAVWAGIGWRDFASKIPELEKFKDFNTMKEISAMTEHLSFGTMLFLVAVIPAIAEELIFRGIIGRGLLARYGVAGILLTTLFFAGVHMHPVHVMAVAPLSIAIHWSYLTTRNLWIPMFAHFLNNSWAVVAMYAFQGQEQQAEPAMIASDGLMPWWVTASALACSLAIGWLLWEIRTIYRTPDRQQWELPFLSTDRPPAELGCTAELTRPSVTSIATSVLGLILFWGAFGVMVAQIVREHGPN